MHDNSPEEIILEAALKVIDEKTISGTRMHLIADEAQMSSANLHYHFRTKKELLMELLRYLQKKFSESRKESFKYLEENLKEQLDGFFHQKKDIILHTPQLDRVQLDYWNLAQVDEEINECFQDTIETWRSHIKEVVSEYRPELTDKELKKISGIMVSMMMGATFQYLSGNEPFDLDDYFDTCEKMVLFYLGVD